MRQVTIRWRSKAVAELQYKLVSWYFTERQNLPETCVEPSLPRFGALSNLWMRQMFPLVALSGPPQPQGEIPILIYFMAVLRSGPFTGCPSTKRHSVKSDYCK
jgi:hypothetical protein